MSRLDSLKSSGEPRILIISDSVGETAELVTRAALSQFGAEHIPVRIVPYVRRIREIRELIQVIVDDQAASRAVIIYTLVVPELRHELLRLAAEHGIRAIDVMTPVLEGLAQVLPEIPSLKAGLNRRIDEDYFKRVEAIEFAIKYDDGKDPRGIQKADVVIVGVSRASKTPLCMYLALKKLKAANVPLVPEVAPPEIIFGLPRHKVIGLTISPLQLNEIRRERLKTMGLTSDADYAAFDRILAELEYADAIMKKIGCPVIDVTNKAVEETASRIMEIYFKGEQHVK